MTAFAQGNQQGDKGDTDVQPRRKRSTLTTTEPDPRAKPGGDGHGIENDHVLEYEGIGHIEQEVARQQDAQIGVEDESNRDRDDEEQDHGSNRRGRRQQAGGQRPVSFGRMCPILVHIHDVVEQINGARYQTEKHKCHNAVQQWLPLRELDVEIKAAKTTRFLLHCRGRMVLNSACKLCINHSESRQRTGGEKCCTAAHLSRPLQTRSNPAPFVSP